MEMKTCSKCLKDYPKDSYYKSEQHADKKYPWCPACKRANYAAKHSESNKASSRRRKYGITDEQFQAKRIAQNFSCAICLKHEDDNYAKKALAVDHNHTTGAVRDLLCRECNIALGYLKDDPELLKRAFDYLMHHQSNMEGAMDYPTFLNASS